MIRDLFVIDKELLGEGDTLKVKLCCSSHTWFVDDDDYNELDTDIIAMKFRVFDEFGNRFPKHVAIDVVGNLNVNVFTKWRPRKEVIRTNQIFIEDYRYSK
ncbi:hypothetical protein D3C76_1478780 [compost metagenome]